MNSMSDDLPHPVPRTAYMRWKENYFFIVKDVKNSVYGIVHISTEPTFNRMIFNVNFVVKGKYFGSLRQSPYPENFAFSKVVTDGVSTLTIKQSHKLFLFSSASDEISIDLKFVDRFPSFDFATCRYATPDLPSFREVHGLGANLPFEHIQQSMTVTGEICVGSEKIAIDALGYRDHSWCFRTDNIVLDHTWCGFNFPDMAIGVMTLRTLLRPGVSAAEGYVIDASGARALSCIDVEIDRRDGVATFVTHRLTDVLGNRYTITSDIENRLADVPLHAEAAKEADVVYKVQENFCRSRINGDVEGIGLVEIGQTKLETASVEKMSMAVAG